MQQIIPIITEPYYSKSSWFIAILKAIEKTAAAQKIKVQVYVDGLSPADIESLPRTVVVATGVSTYMKQIISILEKNGRHVLLAGLSEGELNEEVSYVASTSQYETRLVIEYLASCLRKNIAMVAFREHGMNDAARCFEVLSIAKDYNLPITQRDFYYRGNSLESCMRKFHDNIHKYNAAICPNGASAICLINFCKQNMVEIPEDLFVISFSDMNVANYSSPSLTSVKTDYAMIGSKIVYVWNYLEAHADENTIMNIRVRSQLSIRESTANMPFIAQSPGGNVDHIPPYVDRYYEYRVTNSLFKLEKEMQGFDELDFQIVQMIMDGYSYEEITDRTYMSISGIRYRVKRIFERLNVKNKKMFVKKLQESLGKNKM